MEDTLEDFLYALHCTVAKNGGKVPLSQLAKKHEELHGVEFRVEKYLYVKAGEVGEALKRIPHVVKVKEDAGQLVIRNTHPADMSKEELLRIDQKIRDKAKEVRAKRELPESTEKQEAEKRAKVDEAAAPKNDPVVLHAILRLLEQKGPLSLSALNESFQARWKCPFRPVALGIVDNDIDKYFRDSKHFRLVPGPEGPILSLRHAPEARDIPTVLEQISGVRQQVAVLGVKLEELQTTLERIKLG